MRKLAVGIDIGGTNTVCGMVDREGNIYETFSILTSECKEPLVMVDSLTFKIKNFLNENSEKFELAGIGIGAPNGNYYHGTIEFAPNLPWKGIVELVKLFEGAFDAPAFLTNDANAAAIGEMVYGGAKDMKDFIMITLGTGCGSAFVANGKMIYGHDGFAGELGHTIVFPNGRECGCGRKGCLETYVSASGITRTVSELLANKRDKSELRSIPQEKITSKLIFEAAERGDKIAMEAFNVTSQILGLKLADAVAYTSPEAIFLFGGLANSGKYIFEPTKMFMEENMLNIFKNKVKILPSQLPDNNAAILGASALVWEQLEAEKN